MFGYIRPMQSELKVRELDRFKAAYCGLCHGLKDRYGFFGRFLLSYDFTFLSMLLYQGEKPPVCGHKRCAASPFRKKCFFTPAPAFDLAADYNVILAYWGIKDSIADNGFWKSLPYRGLAVFYKRAFRKAEKRRPNFSKMAGESLQELWRLEHEENTSLDQKADKFAVILAHAADEIADTLSRQASEQLLYHTGRFIYLLDAYDDLKQDAAAGRYNPLIHRFSVKDGKLEEEEKASLKITLTHSLNLISSAYQLLPPCAFSDILENIIYLGMPAVCDQVFSGTWKKKDRTVGHS